MATSTSAIGQNGSYPAIEVPDLVGRKAGYRLSRYHQIAMALDGATIFLATAFIFHGFHIGSISFGFTHQLAHLYLTALIVTIAMTILLDRVGAYRASGSLLGVRETACVLEALFYAALFLVACAIVADVSGLLLPCLMAATLVAISLILQKQACYALWLYSRSRRASSHRVVIYGPAESAISVLEALFRSSKSSLLPIACFSDAQGTDSDRALQRKAKQVKLYSPDMFCSDLLREENVSLVVIASPISSREHLEKILEESARAGATILFGAEPLQLGAVGIEYFELDGQLLYGAQSMPRRHLYESVKRVFDLLAAATLIILGAIPMLLAAIAIAFDTRGPILFRQTRVGLYGRPFTIFKFRTMHTEMCGYKASPMSSEDPRITPVGRWLRKASLDELPQLFNILRGDMTLVGPRPEMPFIVAKYSKVQVQRLTVKPGLTGIWQISNERRHPIHENIHYDLYYLNHRSIFMDVALLLHTAFLAIRGI